MNFISVHFVIYINKWLLSPSKPLPFFLYYLCSIYTILFCIETLPNDVSLFASSNLPQQVIWLYVKQKVLKCHYNRCIWLHSYDLLENYVEI